MPSGIMATEFLLPLMLRLGRLVCLSQLGESAVRSLWTVQSSPI